MISKLKVPLALAVASGAIVYLLATGVAKNDLYMSSLDQWDPARASRESVKIMGFVADGSVKEHPERLETTFTMRNEDATKTLPMRYQGVTPDLFREGSAVVASGRLAGDGTFEATDLMTKCPSKYEGMEHVPTAPGQAADVR